jgi:hypothetical protein
MKTRVIKIKNRYYPQRRKCFIWRSFNPNVTGVISFKTEREARIFCHTRYPNGEFLEDLSLKNFEKKPLYSINEIVCISRQEFSGTVQVMGRIVAIRNNGEGKFSYLVSELPTMVYHDTPRPDPVKTAQYMAQASMLNDMNSAVHPVVML